MLKTEFLDCFEYMKSLFPRMNDHDHMMDIWYKSFANYTPTNFKAGVQAYVQRVGDKAPNIPDIRSCIGAACGENALEKRRVDLAKPHFSEVEFVMDAFGPKAVTLAMKNLVGENPRWADLVDRKDWVPTYKLLLKELLDEAKELQKSTPNSDWWGYRSLDHDRRRAIIDAQGDLR